MDTHRRFEPSHGGREIQIEKVTDKNITSQTRCSWYELAGVFDSLVRVSTQKTRHSDVHDKRHAPMSQSKTARTLFIHVQTLLVIIVAVP